MGAKVLAGRLVVIAVALLLVGLVVFEGRSSAAPAMTLQQAVGRTVWDGAYTEEQAERGADEYAMYCARCHEGVCPDGPPLVGPLFVERWREDNLGSLFLWVSTRMPRNANGSLSEKTYLDSIAHLLKANGFPVGQTELTAANARGIQVVGQNGPRPLPGNAVVEMVGCFTKGPEDSFQLTQATVPVRYRYGSPEAPDALSAAGARPLGQGTYELTNVRESRSDLNPESITGQRVRVRGPLLRQRVHVTMLDALPGACTQ